MLVFFVACILQDIRTKTLLWAFYNPKIKQNLLLALYNLKIYQNYMFSKVSKSYPNHMYPELHKRNVCTWSQNINHSVQMIPWFHIKHLSSEIYLAYKSMEPLLAFRNPAILKLKTAVLLFI